MSQRKAEEPKRGGLTLANVRRLNRPFTGKIETQEGEAEFAGTFNPRVYSPNYLHELEDLDSKDPRSWAVILAGAKPPLLSSWELTYGPQDAEDGLCSPEEVGNMVPIEVDRLAALPIEVLTATADGIAEAARPKPITVASENNSGTSSFQEEEAGEVLTSIDSSEQSGSTKEP